MSCSKLCPCLYKGPVDTLGSKRDPITSKKDWLIFAVRLLSREVAEKGRGQEAIWNNKYKPLWWDDNANGPWKNPTINPKDTIEVLLKKYEALENHLRKEGKFPTELEEEAKLFKKNNIEELLWRRKVIDLYGAVECIRTKLQEFKTPCMRAKITELLFAVKSDDKNGQNTSNNMKRRKPQTNAEGSKKARQQNFTPQSLQGTSTSGRAVFTTSVPAVPKGHSTVASDAISCTIATTSSVLSEKPTIFPVTCNPETVVSVSPSKVKLNKAGVNVPSCSGIASESFNSLGTSISCQKVDNSNDSLSFDPSNIRAVLDASGSKNPDKDCQSANRSALSETSSASPPARSISRIVSDRSDSVGTGRNCETDSTASAVSQADVQSCSSACPAKLDSFGTVRTFQNPSDSSVVSMANVPSDGTAVSDKSDNYVRDFQHSDDSTNTKPQTKVLSGSKASTTSDGSDNVKAGSDSGSPENNGMPDASHANNTPMVELNQLFSEEEQHQLWDEEGSLLSNQFLQDMKAFLAENGLDVTGDSENC